MGNRAVITFNKANSSPCIYLHWNGGRASVEAFLGAARQLGLRTITSRTEVQVMDSLAHLIARHFIGTEVNKLTVYREPYGRADKDNWDNGVYVLDHQMHICGRDFVRGDEEVNPEKTKAIREEILKSAPYFND